MKKHPELELIGAHIRALRTAEGFSQEAFAHNAGIHPRYYGAIERGETNVASKNLLKIAYALKVEVGQSFPAIRQLRKAK